MGIDDLLRLGEIALATLKKRDGKNFLKLAEVSMNPFSQSLTIRMALVAMLCLLATGNAQADLFQPLGIGQLPDGSWAEQYVYTLYSGESVGWHMHPGPLAIIVASGTLIEDRGCDAPLETHVTGAAFTENPGVVHAVVNNGAEPVTLLISGIVPSCYGNYNDTVFVAQPQCKGESGRSHIVEVQACQ